MAGAKWTLEAARDALLLAGYEIAEVLPIPHGRQIRCVGGQLVSIYDKGSFLAQGRDVATVKALFAAGPDQDRTAAGQEAPAPIATPMSADPSTRPAGRPRPRAATGLPSAATSSPTGAAPAEIRPAANEPAANDLAGRVAAARRVTDYPSERPEDAGLPPPW